MRRGRAEKIEVLPDPKYHSKLVAHFVNIIMTRGKKSVAEKILYRCFDSISEKAGSPSGEAAGKKDPLEILQKAIDNVRPLLEVKSRRVGGATYQVPIEVKTQRGITIALRWMRNFARARKGKPMEEKLAAEILDAYKGEGPAVKKREDTHKMAEANKAFAHYRW